MVKPGSRAAKRLLEARARAMQMRRLQKGQRVRAEVIVEQGGVVLCRRGDYGTVLAVKDLTIAHIDWFKYGRVCPSRIDQLERADGRCGPIAQEVEVRRPLPVVDGKGGQLLAPNQRGTVIVLEERVGVAVLFDRHPDNPLSHRGPANAVWMVSGIEPVQNKPEVFEARTLDELSEKGTEIDFCCPDIAAEFHDLYMSEKDIDMPEIDFADPVGVEQLSDTVSTASQRLWGLCDTEALEFLIDGSEAHEVLLPGHGFIENTVGDGGEQKLRSDTPRSRRLTGSGFMRGPELVSSAPDLDPRRLFSEAMLVIEI